MTIKKPDTVHHMNAFAEQSPIAGTQVVGRIASVLRAVSESMPHGAGTSELTRAVNLPRPTVHRLLASLSVQGFVDRDLTSGNWFLGPELFLMGTLAAERYDITPIADEHIAALAEETGESAFLSARRGFETICLIRKDGSFPIRSFVLYEGKRFPLGVASAGIAILSFLPDRTIDQYLEQAHLDRQYGVSHDPDQLRARIAHTRSVGYAVNPGLIVEGSWGLGAAVFDSSGQPAWALSLTGIEPRFSEQRRPALGQLLLEHAHRLGQSLAARK